MKRRFIVSRAYLYFLIVAIVASGLTLLFIDMTDRAYSFTAPTLESLEKTNI